MNKLHTVPVTIAEVPGRGWLWKERGRYYKTAAHAHRRVLRDGKEFARAGTNVAHVITWEPATPAGSIVVRAL